MRFFTGEVRILRLLPGARPLVGDLMPVQDLPDRHVRDLGDHLPPHQMVRQLAQRPLIEGLAEGPRGHGGDLHHHRLVFRGQRRGAPRMGPRAKRRQPFLVVLAQQLAPVLLVQVQRRRQLLHAHPLGAEGDQLPSPHLHGIARPLQPPAQFLGFGGVRGSSMETHGGPSEAKWPYVPMIQRLTQKYKSESLTEH